MCDSLVYVWQDRRGLLGVMWCLQPTTRCWAVWRSFPSLLLQQGNGPLRKVWLRWMRRKLQQLQVLYPLHATVAAMTASLRASDASCRTREQCVSRCGCQAPRVVGRCRAAIRSYYFDAETNRCMKFTYGGCGGNDNRFRSVKKENHHFPINHRGRLYKSLVIIPLQFVPSVLQDMRQTEADQLYIFKP